MIFEATVCMTTIDNRGNDRQIKRSFLLVGCETFSDAEAKLYEEFGSEAGFDVCAIKISKLRDIANERPNGDTECKIFIMTICDYFTNEDGSKKELKYNVACFAKDIKEAHLFATQYIMQGLEDMELKQLKETNILDVIR